MNIKRREKTRTGVADDGLDRDAIDCYANDTAALARKAILLLPMPIG